MKKIWIIAVVFVIIIGGAIFRFTSKPRKNTTEVPAPTEKAVEVVEALRGEIRSELELSGTIEANSQVTVFPEVAGEIIKMTVDEGSQIRKGEILAVIEHEELELHVRQAEAAYQAVQTAHDQAQRLAEIRVKSQIDQARAQLAFAEAFLQQVEDLAEIRAISQIEAAEAGLGALHANLEKIKRGARDEDRKRVQATVDQAMANLANAENNYKRMKNLFESGAISKQSFETSKTQLDVAKAQYAVVVEQKRLIDSGEREEDIRAVEAQVRQAEASLELVRAQVETKTWEKDKALARSQVEAARAALEAVEALEAAKSWEAEITSAETAMAQAKAVLDLAKKRVGDATITAPISGIVSNRHLDLGGMASPTVPIVEIVDMDTVKATVSVIESDLGKLKVGDSAQIQVDALLIPVVGQISLISPTLDRASRSAKIELTIDNPNLDLKPGMFAQVKISVDIHENAILIDRAAVIEDSVRDTRTVFVVENEQGKRRPVEFGLAQGSKVEIISGLAEGEHVVIAGQHTLKDGEKVKVMNQ